MQIIHDDPSGLSRLRSLRRLWPAIRCVRDARRHYDSLLEGSAELGNARAIREALITQERALLDLLRLHSMDSTAAAA